MDVMTEKNQWWVYLAECHDGTLYTGITTDLSRRIAQHNGLKPGGAKYTAHRRPVTLVYQEPCADRSSASKREYVIRKLPKVRKQALAIKHADDGNQPS
jgi:putative endonuclease